MDIQQLKRFFLYCIFTKGVLFVFWIFFLLFTRDLVYRLQYAFIPLPRQTMMPSFRDFSAYSNSSFCFSM